MTTNQHTQANLRAAKRWAIRGFLTGVAITVPATFFALLSPIGEVAFPFLVPANAVLRPLADVVARWPGLANVALACLVNGVIYAAVAVAVHAAVGKTRRQ